MLWSCALLLVFISHYEVRWSRESDRRCVDSDCVCCRLQAVQVAHLWELSSTSHRREREGGVKRTENHGEQADSIRVPGCVHCAQKKTCEICVNFSLLWNIQWQMKQTADSISVFLNVRGWADAESACQLFLFGWDCCSCEHSAPRFLPTQQPPASYCWILIFFFFIRFYFYVNFRLWIICFHDTSYTRRTNNREKHFNGVFMKTMDLLFPLTTKLKIYHKECFYTGSLNLQ